jgi:hypothetical protein
VEFFNLLSRYHVFVQERKWKNFNAAVKAA